MTITARIFTWLFNGPIKSCPLSGQAASHPQPLAEPAAHPAAQPASYPAAGFSACVLFQTLLKG